MTTAYFSTVLTAPADTVWAVVRDFGNYSWAGAEYSATLEHDRAGDAVGAIRRIGDDGSMRQQLVALSDVDRTFTYDVLPGSPIEVDHYRATVRVAPVTDTDETFVEWTATFDCDPAEADRWRQFYANDRFPAWLAALRKQVSG